MGILYHNQPKIPTPIKLGGGGFERILPSRHQPPLAVRHTRFQGTTSSVRRASPTPIPSHRTPSSPHRSRAAAEPSFALTAPSAQGATSVIASATNGAYRFAFMNVLPRHRTIMKNPLPRDNDAHCVLPYAPRLTRLPFGSGSASYALAGSPRSIAGEFTPGERADVPSLRT